MAELFRISAKNLGSLALDDACDRCEWLKLKCELPYQSFPGVFSSIDSYTKKFVDNHFTKSGALPAWLSEIGKVKSCLPSLHHSKFNTAIPEYGILLTGAVDALFKFADGSLCIADYKTAKFTKNQDSLLPEYKVQLNGYAFIAEKIGLGSISKLALIYFQPETEQEHAADPSNSRSRGFALGFSPHILPIEISPDKWLHPYLKKARTLFDLSSPPASRKDCEECSLLERLISLTGR